MLEFKVRGLEQLRRDLREVSKEIATKVIDKACRASAQYFAREARARCSSKEVAASIKVLRLPGEDDPKQFTYLVVSGKTRVAHLIEFGTKAHSIAPNLKTRKAKNVIGHRMAGGEVITLQGPQAPGASDTMTRVVNRGGASLAVIGRTALRFNGTDFRSAVKHPGARARAFMRPAFDESGDAAITEFVRTAERAFASLARKGELTGQYWGNA